MSFWDVRRSIVSGQLLTHLAAEHGVSEELCLNETGIEASSLADPETEISASQELQLVRNFVQALGHIPGIGIDAGLRYHLSAYGIWGYALVSSPTFSSGCELAIRYIDLSYAFTRFRLQMLRGVPQVSLGDEDIPVELRRFLVERDFAASFNALQEMLPGGARLRGLQFNFPRPSYGARYAEAFGIEPRFDAEITAAEFDPEIFMAPLPQANPVMARLCEEQCRQLLARRQVRTGIAGRVRDRLLRAPHKIPAIDEVASELCMATRSLRRRLEEEGSSFRTLLDEVRQTLAEEMLTVSGMKLDEIAKRLDYSEPAAFIHAFQRWNGISPTEFRIAKSRRTASSK